MAEPEISQMLSVQRVDKGRDMIEPAERSDRPAIRYADSAAPGGKALSGCILDMQM